jgi:dienelactone hydrolase
MAGEIRVNEAYAAVPAVRVKVGSGRDQPAVLVRSENGGGTQQHLAANYRIAKEAYHAGHCGVA